MHKIISSISDLISKIQHKTKHGLWGDKKINLKTAYYVTVICLETFENITDAIRDSGMISCNFSYSFFPFYSSGTYCLLEVYIRVKKKILPPENSIRRIPQFLSVRFLHLLYTVYCTVCSTQNSPYQKTTSNYFIDKIN